MTEAIRLSAQLRELPTLDQKFALFVDYMKSEHHYDAVTYVICLDNRSTDSMLRTTIMKEHGLQPEWMKQYIDEQLGQNDVAIPMVYTSDKPILLSRLFDAAANEKMAPRFCEPLVRFHDYARSGLVVPAKHHNLRAGFGLHSRSIPTCEHDARYANNGWLIAEMCQLFHASCRWTDDIIAHTGLSDLNLLVLRLKAQGKGVKEILSVIGRKNDKTVENHMRRVRKKLGVAKDSEAIAKASALGLVHGPDELPRDQLRDSFEDWLE